MRKLRNSLFCIACIGTVGLPLAGCAIQQARWPEAQEERLYPVVAAGSFRDVRPTDAPPCLGTDDPAGESGLIVDCFSGTPSVSRFEVIDVLHGTLPGKTVTVAFHPPMGSSRPPGEGLPVMVVLHSDGAHHFLNYPLTDVARLETGEWALVVRTNSDLSMLPCGAERFVRPLNFASPLPRMKLGNYELENTELMNELQHDPRVIVRGKYVYYTHGISLSDVRSFINSAERSFENLHCPQ